MPVELSRIRLPSGRTLSYTDLGDPDGAPVLLFHGTPACSASFDAFDEPARSVGVRAIAPDRPGIRLSSFQRKRALADWPADVTALADELGIGRFSVLGWSGGGPYALACGALIPERLAVCGVAAGVAPPEMPGAIDGLSESDRRLTRMATRSPAAARLTLATMGFIAKRWPARARDALEQELAPVDVDVTRRYWPGEFTLFTEIFRHGARGVVRDYALVAKPWGFALEDVRTPVRIWHGDADRAVPLAQARWMAERLPTVTLDVLPGEGHFFLLDRAADMLSALAPRAEPSSAGDVRKLD
jgi:pimeloyl-ACP methyl ester carboxylesterase